MKLEEIINVDPEIQFGTPVFTGTRVPIESIFWHLEKGITLDDFLEDFPSVSREQAVALMEVASKTLTRSDFSKFYEIAA
ncbi:MAG: DUF433 domain-containing protein [Sphingobacteriaceae bacterium]|nr:DUF433 domain-containing protein [Cytophagaceae bacterium]